MALFAGLGYEFSMTIFQLALSLFFFSFLAESSINFRNCDWKQKAQVLHAHEAVKERSSELLNQRNGIDKYNLVWVANNYIKKNGFKPSTRWNFVDHARTYQRFHAKISHNLKKMKQKLDQGFVYSCQTARDRNCQSNGGVVAYTKRFGRRVENKIYLCPGFFKESHNGKETTLFHELSHLAADTDHYFGSVFDDQGMLKQADDAYFFERMYNNELENYLYRHSWGFLWTSPLITK